jgi:HD superfamily phosphohydrolase
MLLPREGSSFSDTIDASIYLKRVRASGTGFYYDPLYGYIPLRPVIRQAIDLPEVQRLRGLKQLSILYLVFPGAVHTRFEHSIGTLYLSELAWSCLIRKQADIEDKARLELTECHLLSLQLASLFHDIGHGPFSHIFESFCDRYEKSEYTHETITSQLIENGLGRYKNIPLFLRQLVSWFEERNYEKKEARLLEPSNIANLAKGFPPTVSEYTEYAFLGQLLKFPVDIDRMDYLRRDAFHTGVETGVTDIWDILHHFTLYRDEAKKVWLLKVEAEASEAVEALLKTREQTYRKVYYNPLHRSSQELLIRAFHDLVESKKYDMNELVLKDDQEAMDIFEKEGTALCKKVASRLRWRHLYENLPFSLNMSRDFESNSKEKRAILWKKEYIKVVETETKLAKDMDLHPGDTVIFDLETVPLAKDEDFKTPILLTRNGEPRSMLELCPHLELVYGEYKDPRMTEPIPLGEVWREKLSNFFIYVPLELIDRFAKEILRQFSHEKKTLKELDKNFVVKYCQETLSHCSTMVTALLDLVQIPEKKKKQIINDFESRMAEYLVRYINS